MDIETFRKAQVLVTHIDRLERSKRTFEDTNDFSHIFEGFFPTSIALEPSTYDSLKMVILVDINHQLNISHDQLKAL